MGRRQQVTEVEDFDETGAGMARESFLTRPMPSWLARSLFALFGLLVVVAIAGFGKYHIYEKHLRETIPEAQARFEQLSPEMTESDILPRYAGLPWRCTYQDSAANGGMGDKVCFTSLNRAYGHPALTLAFFFNKKKLNLGLLHVPWWAHGRAVDAARQRYGIPVSKGDMLYWSLPNGTVAMNRSRSINPLNWSAIVWTRHDPSKPTAP